MKDRFDTKLKGVRVLETASGLVANLKITIETKMKEPQLAEVKILIIKKSGVYFRTIRVNLARCVRIFEERKSSFAFLLHR